MRRTLLIVAMLASFSFYFAPRATAQQRMDARMDEEVVLGASRTDVYMPLLEGKRVALLSNHTGVADGQHTLDRLLAWHQNVVAIFSPEHGFRGTAEAGGRVGDSVDESTGVPIVSLYDGTRQYPSDETMALFDVLVVDIQDVGLRFYTYYVTLVRMMQICAEKDKQVVVLDRPNPNGYYVDGPILDMKYKSGVGYLPIPIVHGMTLGELAQMVNGEHWLRGRLQCQLTVVPCLNYTHQTRYRLPIAPSPNLQSMLAVYLYPSMCYFEATPVSLGRGTNKPFLQYGHPKMKKGAKPVLPNGEKAAVRGAKSAKFTPRSCAASKTPPQQDRMCRGVDLTGVSEEAAMEMGVNLTFLIDAYHRLQIDNWFFSAFFEKLVGVGYVRKMIEEGKNADEIRAMWADDVKAFKELRRPYLLYEE